jgi:hypothetical protein
MIDLPICDPNRVRGSTRIGAVPGGTILPRWFRGHLSRVSRYLDVGRVISTESRSGLLPLLSLLSKRRDRSAVPGIFVFGSGQIDRIFHTLLRSSAGALCIEMKKVEQYRRLATEARAEAARVGEEKLRRAFLEIAEAWDLLADERQSLVDKRGNKGD